MVPSRKAAGGCSGFVLTQRSVLETLSRRHLFRFEVQEVALPCNFSARVGFATEGSRIMERRWLCDAKLKLTIPGAQSPSPLFERVI